MKRNNFQTTNKCHTCNEFYTGKDIRVKNNCHVTDKYITSNCMLLSCHVRTSE